MKGDNERKEANDGRRRKDQSEEGVSGRSDLTPGTNVGWGLTPGMGHIFLEGLLLFACSQGQQNKIRVEAVLTSDGQAACFWG